MRIWVFGDSYAVHCPKTEWSWVEHVKSCSGATCVEANAIHGSSLDWVYYRFELTKKQIRSEDIILVILTSFDRRWFLKNQPNTTSFANSTINLALSHDEKNAVKAYYQYLDNHVTTVLNLISWLDMLDLFIKEHKVRCLVISAFPDTKQIVNNDTYSLPMFEVRNGNPIQKNQTSISVGQSRYKNISLASGDDLFSIYYNECVNPNILRPELDYRLNHLCRDNHEILSEKIIQWIHSDCQVELTGFHSGIITPDVLQINQWQNTKLISNYKSS